MVIFGKLWILIVYACRSLPWQPSIRHLQYNKVIEGLSRLWGAERRVLGARAPTKFSEEILQWAGTHKVLAEKVRGNGNFRLCTYSYISM